MLCLPGYILFKFQEDTDGLDYSQRTSGKNVTMPKEFSILKDVRQRLSWLLREANLGGGLYGGTPGNQQELYRGKRKHVRRRKRTEEGNDFSDSPRPYVPARDAVGWEGRALRPAALMKVKLGECMCLWVLLALRQTGKAPKGRKKKIQFHLCAAHIQRGGRGGSGDLVEDRKLDRRRTTDCVEKERTHRSDLEDGFGKIHVLRFWRCWRDGGPEKSEEGRKERIYQCHIKTSKETGKEILA